MGILKLVQLKIDHQREMAEYKKMHNALVEFNKIRKQKLPGVSVFPMNSAQISHVRKKVFHQVSKIKSIEKQMMQIQQSSYFSKGFMNSYGFVSILLLSLISLIALSYVSF